jgi:hypothetical protein
MLYCIIAVPSIVRSHATIKYLAHLLCSWGGPGSTVEKFIVPLDKLLCFQLKEVCVICYLPSCPSFSNFVIFKFVVANLFQLWEQMTVLQCQISPVSRMLHLCIYKIIGHADLFSDVPM